MNILNRVFSRKILYILGCLLFFSTYILITSDSVEYYYYIDIFSGKMPLDEWNPERGILMPLILFIGKIVSNNAQGILFVFCVFYLLLCWGVVSFLRFIDNNAYEWLINLLVFVFLVLNPIVFSFSHTILTEFPAAVLTVFSFAIGFIFLQLRIKNAEKERKYSIIYIILSLFETLLFSMLKTNYIPIILVVICGFEFVLLLEKRNKKNAFYLLVLLMACFIEIGVYSKITTGISGYKGDGGAVVIGGLRYFEIENADHKDGSTRIPAYLSGKRMISVMDDNENVIKEFDYEFESSFLNHLGFVVECFKECPQRAFAGYVDNYMLICDLYGRPWDDGKPIQYQTGHVIKGNIFNNLFDNNGKKQINQEYRTFNTWIREDIDTEWLVSVFKSNNWNFWNEHVEPYRDINGGLIGRSICANTWFDFFLFLYSMMVLISPVMFIYSLILLLKNRSSFVILHFVGSAVVFSQVMMLAISGAVVDRYMFPAFLLLIILLIIDVRYIIQTTMKGIHDGKFKKSTV